MKRSMSFLFAVMVMCSGLAITRGYPGSPTAAQWLHSRSPGDLAHTSWSEIPSSQVHPVIHAKSGEAFRLMADHDCLALDAQQVRKFGIAAPADSGLASYLVRAVRNSGPNGAYKLFTDGNALVVQHGSLAKHTSLERDVLVVDLPRPPTAVFVEVSIDE